MDQEEVSTKSIKTFLNTLLVNQTAMRGEVFEITKFFKPPLWSLKLWALYKKVKLES